MPVFYEVLSSEGVIAAVVGISCHEITGKSRYAMLLLPVFARSFRSRASPLQWPAAALTRKSGVQNFKYRCNAACGSFAGTASVREPDNPAVEAAARALSTMSEAQSRPDLNGQDMLQSSSTLWKWCQA